jgi:tetratricopeptide (TPR) repeat protein
LGLLLSHVVAFLRGHFLCIGLQLEAAGKHEAAIRVWNFMAWAFATSSAPQVFDPKMAMVFAQRIVEMTKRQDPQALDTLAAAQAASGQYEQAIQTAQAAIKLANSQDNKRLADAISRRLQFYQQGKPYRCGPGGSERP